MDWPRPAPHVPDAFAREGDSWHFPAGGVGTLATSTIRLTSGNSGIVGFVLDGMFDARVPGTVTIEGEMLSKDRGVYEIATIDGCIGTSALVRWCVQGSATPSGWAGHLEIVDGNRLVVRLVPRGGWIILK